MFPLRKQGRQKVSFSVQDSTGSLCVWRTAGFSLLTSFAVWFTQKDRLYFLTFFVCVTGLWCLLGYILVSSKQILLSGWRCKHVEQVWAPVGPACGEVATVTCLNGAGSRGRGQRRLLLQTKDRWARRHKKWTNVQNIEVWDTNVLAEVALPANFQQYKNEPHRWLHKTYSYCLASMIPTQPCKQFVI